MKKYIVTLNGRPGSRMVDADMYEVVGSFVHFDVVDDNNKRKRVASFNAGCVAGIVEQR